MLKHTKLFLLLTLTTQVFAGSPALQDITEADFKKITKEFGANFVHTSVTSANPLGDTFGIEIGVIGGVTTADDIKAITKEIDSESNLKYIPHAALMAQLTIPWGISFEATMLPEKEVGNITIDTFSFATKWSLTHSVLKIPLVDLAIRAHMGNGNVNYKTSSKVSDVPLDSKVSIENSSYGINFSAGLDLIFLRPYIGFGYVKGDSKMKVDSVSGTIFDTSFTASKEAKQSLSGAHLFIGTEFDLTLLHIGAEYSKVFGKERYTFKASLAF